MSLKEQIIFTIIITLNTKVMKKNKTYHLMNIFKKMKLT